MSAKLQLICTIAIPASNPSPDRMRHIGAVAVRIPSLHVRVSDSICAGIVFWGPWDMMKSGPARSRRYGTPAEPFPRISRRIRALCFPVDGISGTMPIHVHSPSIRSMQAYVYKSRRKPETYVYFAVQDDFSSLPESLLAELGDLQPVLEITLNPERRLARAEIGTVMASLRSQGFYIQFPPPADHPVSPADV